jgi:putative ABC transport system permease protein
MWTFAWRNLLTRPLRTTLALVGLSIPILGVVGLFSLSDGLRNLVGDTLRDIQGVMVLRENAPSPVFSSLDATIVAKLWKVPRVQAVAPEVWGIAPPIEGTSFISKSFRDFMTKSKEQRFQSIFDAIVIQGQDIAAHRQLKSAVYPRKLLPGPEGGRFLRPEDQGKNRVVISKKIANDFKDAQGRPKRVGDTLHIGDENEPFEIIGIYETGSMFLDVVLLMDIDVARRLLNHRPGSISSVYVEGKDPAHIDQLAAEIEARIPGVDARSMEEFAANFSRIWGQLDKFLLMIVSLALLVGIIGIINTMLMSTTERFTEFGVLRTNGWSQGNVLSLVTIESAYLGLLAGALGCLLAFVGATVANQFLGGGLKLTLTPRLLAMGIALSLGMGMLGGLYPAWRAARLVPMDAIRLGAH